MSLCHGKYIDSSARTGTRARARVDLLPRKNRLLITLQRRASAAPLAFFFCSYANFHIFSFMHHPICNPCISTHRMNITKSAALEFND